MWSGWNACPMFFLFGKWKNYVTDACRFNLDKEIHCQFWHLFGLLLPNLVALAVPAGC